MKSDRQLTQVRVRIRAHQTLSADYSIYVGDDVLNQTGGLARISLPYTARRVCIVSNKKVFSLYGERVTRSLEDSGFVTTQWLMPDGERHKSLRSVERALRFFSEAGLERSDGVIALGGGVVGDVAGFAAALHLRGLNFIQVPTTLLAQIDSSVGGKTGVNTDFGKNLLGVFHQPSAVVIDVATLRSLPPREITAGMCEAIKHGAIASRALFRRTHSALTNINDKASLIELIATQCSFKASIVSSDEREDIDRTDRRSRKILNFGHTIGHALETLTDYRYFRHGEAVGYGMIAAAEISNALGLLKKEDLFSLKETLKLAGRLPRASHLDQNKLLMLLERDKKTVAGNLKWVLLERIGRPKIIDGREIPQALVREAIARALTNVSPT